MTREEVIKNIKEKFGASVLNIFDKSPKRLYVDIKPESLGDFAGYLFRELGCRFNIASGMDTRSSIEILYHFTLEDINLLISLRVRLDRDKPEINSIAVLFEAANWIERELHEILGVDFKGHPDMRRLLLPDNWPEGVYPMRTDYKEWDKGAIRDRGV